MVKFPKKFLAIFLSGNKEKHVQNGPKLHNPFKSCGDPSANTGP